MVAVVEEDDLSKAIGGVKWPVCLNGQEHVRAHEKSIMQRPGSKTENEKN